MKTYNWGIIGTGLIAREMASALTACRGAVYGVCGTSREKAERFAAENGFFTRIRMQMHCFRMQMWILYT